MTPSKLLGLAILSPLLLGATDSRTLNSPGSFPSTVNCDELVCVEIGPIPIEGGVVPVMLWGSGTRGTSNTDAVPLERSVAGAGAFEYFGGMKIARPGSEMSAAFGSQVGFFPATVKRNSAAMRYALVPRLDRAFDYRLLTYSKQSNPTVFQFAEGSGPTVPDRSVSEFPPPTRSISHWIAALGCRRCSIHRWEGRTWKPIESRRLVLGDVFRFARKDGRLLVAIVPGRSIA